MSTVVNFSKKIYKLVIETKTPSFKITRDYEYVSASSEAEAIRLVKNTSKKNKKIIDIQPLVEDVTE
jgi:uncharacterized protein YktA (UPF0223 family)